MEQKCNVQLNSKCKIIDIYQKLSTKLLYKCPAFTIPGLANCYVFYNSGKKETTLWKKETIMAKNKDLRFIRTNHMLCSAFTELLEKKKFEDITVNEMCEKALIRRATFYTHFLDKYDFFAYFVRQNRDNFISRLAETKEERNLMDFSIYMFRQMVHYLSEHMTMVQNILSSNAFSILLDILAEEIQISFLEELHRIDAVKLRKDIVPQVAAAYYSGGIIQILRYWVTSRDSLSEELLVKQYSILLGMFLTE